jgi:hypothetical protein
MRWLRENGRYLTPSGLGDLMFMLSYYLCALIGVQVVIGVVLFGVALAFYSLRLLLDWYVPLTQFWALGWAAALREGEAIWWSPILWLAPAWLAAVSVPLVLTYWVVYQQHDARRRTLEEWAVELGPIALGAGAFALAEHAATVTPGNPLRWVLLYATAVSAVSVFLRNGWFCLTLPEKFGWRLRAPRVSRVRQTLVKWLRSSLYVAFALAGIGVVDSLGQSVFIGVVRDNLFAWGSGGAGVLVAFVAIQRAADWIGGESGTKFKRFVAHNYKLVALIVALAVLIALAAVHAAVLQSICWSDHLPRWRAQAPIDWADVSPTRADAPTHNEALRWTWGVWSVIAVCIGLSIGFLNNSTLHRFYASRLMRTYLGAANFSRMRQFGRERYAAATYGSTVVQTHENDDIRLDTYYRAPTAGPLHIVNVTLNESVSRTSNLQREDRKGVAMSIGPAGIGVNGSFHPWRPAASAADDASPAADPPTPLEASVQDQALSAWMAISGAAVSTGLGRMSSVGTSMLSWLANIRLGYWWKPPPQLRAVAPEVAQRQASPWWPANAFRLMQQEMLGQFNGKPDRYWNLSDGGHFENTGAYELIRRRVPLIFVADNGADAKYAFNDVQNLVRRVRIDLGAEIRFMDGAELDNLVNQSRAEHGPLRALLGAPNDFQPSPKMTSKCVLVATVEYAPDAAGRRASSRLVLMKPALTCFAPIDVRAYGETHPDFPQQSTADQFFDEAQWESYRKLGLEIGRALFAHWGAFVDAVPRAAGVAGEVQIKATA